MTDLTKQINGLIDQSAMIQLLAGQGRIYSNLQQLMADPGNKENLFRWTQPSNAGNTGGPSGKKHGTFTWVPGQGLGVWPIAEQEDNFYLYMLLPPPVTAPTLFNDFRTHQIQNLAGWQALEFEQQLTWFGRIHNMAWQFAIVEKAVRYFDYQHSKWIATTIPLPDLTKPVTTIAEFAVDTVAGTTTHIALTVNGVRYPVGITQTAAPTTGANKLTIAEQIDPQQAGKACSLLIGNIELRYI